MQDSDQPHTEPLATPSLGETEESLPMLLATCVKYIRDNLNACFVEAGSNITSEQWRVLTVLSRQDGISQLELAQQLDRTEVSVLNLLKKLEARSYVLRQRDPVDARCKRVFLTSPGRKIQRELVPVALANRARVCRGVGEDDVRKLRRILHKMIENTKKA